MFQPNTRRLKFISRNKSSVVDERFENFEYVNS